MRTFQQRIYFSNTSHKFQPFFSEKIFTGRIASGMLIPGIICRFPNVYPLIHRHNKRSSSEEEQNEGTSDSEKETMVTVGNGRKNEE